MNNFLDSVGARLRSERERLGYSQEAFAALAEASRPTQFNYESNKRAPDSNYLIAVAAAGADVLYILTGQRGTQPAPALKPDEAALLDNYRNSPQEGKQQLEASSALYAQLAKKKRA